MGVMQVKIIQSSLSSVPGKGTVIGDDIIITFHMQINIIVIIIIIVNSML